MVGSLAPGRDGVGDYARTLAAAFNQAGHVARLVALHDGDVVDLLIESAGIMRVPAGWSWSKKISSVRPWLREFSPDWISLQLVLFGFEKRGLPWCLGSRLQGLLAGWRVAVTAHEIAMGFQPNAPWRHRLYGRGQRLILRGIFSRLRPDFVHTSTEFYRRWLAGIGVSAELLALHSNIPLTAGREAGRSWLMERAGVVTEPVMLAGFFGEFSPMFCLRNFELWLAKARTSGRSAVVFSAGKVSPAAWNAFSSQVGKLCRVIRLGELEAREVSLYLKGLDVGLTSYPPSLAEKSGALAAMCTHGLTVQPLGVLTREEIGGGLSPEIQRQAVLAVDTARDWLARAKRAGALS